MWVSRNATSTAYFMCISDVDPCRVQFTFPHAIFINYFLDGAMPLNYGQSNDYSCIFAASVNTCFKYIFVSPRVTAEGYI